MVRNSRNEDVRTGVSPEGDYAARVPRRPKAAQSGSGDEERAARVPRRPQPQPSPTTAPASPPPPQPAPKPDKK